MKPTRTALAAAAAVLAPTSLMAMTLPADAHRAQPNDPEPITIELLTPRGRFTDRVIANLRVRPTGARMQHLAIGDPSGIVVARVTVQPGAMFPWHLHPGPVIGTIAEGELVITNADDCVDRPYPTGTAFVEPGDKIHTARNRTDGVTTVIATFLDAPPEGPLTVTQGIEPPSGCEIPVGDPDSHDMGGT
jgi:quercetin dioxygenase-like cupin family protein